MTERRLKRLTLQDRLSGWVEKTRQHASELEPGPARDALLKKPSRRKPQHDMRYGRGRRDRSCLRMRGLLATPTERHNDGSHECHQATSRTHLEEALVDIQTLARFASKSGDTAVMERDLEMILTIGEMVLPLKSGQRHRSDLC